MDARFTATLCCRVAREVKRQAERQAEEAAAQPDGENQREARRAREEERALRRQEILKDSRNLAEGMSQQVRLAERVERQGTHDSMCLLEDFLARTRQQFLSLVAAAGPDRQPTPEDLKHCFEVGTFFE